MGRNLSYFKAIDGFHFNIAVKWNIVIQCRQLFEVSVNNISTIVIYEDIFHCLL